MFAAPQARAQSECGSNTGAPITCPPGAYPDGVQYHDDTPLKLTVGGVTTTADDEHAVDVSSTTAALDVEASDISTSGDGAVGVKAWSESGEVTIRASGVQTSGGPGPILTAEGVLAETVTGDISVIADDIGVSGQYASAIAAVSGSGDISIDSGRVESTALGAVAILARTDSAGSATVSSDSLTATGQGIFVQAVGDVSLTSGTLTVASGAEAGATGLYAYSIGGDVVIESGMVSTDALRGRAVSGFSDAASVTITSQSITTVQNGATGLRAAAAGDVVIDSGSITTTGSTDVDAGGMTRNAEGIWAFSPTGDISVASDSIVTSGNNAHGILIDADGDVPWTGHRGADPDNGTGVLTIVSGDIETHGDWARGILVDHRGQVSVESERVHTTGEGGWGIYVYGSDGVSIDSGSVIVEGDIGPGIVARTDRGDIAITSGFVQSSDDVGISGVSDEGDVTIVSETVRTTLSGPIVRPDGFTPDGVYAWSGTGSVTVDSGSVDVLADDAWGIIGMSTSGAVSVTSDGISTSGARGYGLYARSGGDVTVDSGSIATLGVEGVGIRAFSNGAGEGDVNVTSGSITTEGDEADGIWAFSPAGAISIVSGSITTNGAQAAGIIVDRDADSPFTGHRGAQADNGVGALDIASGTIVTHGEGSVGIHVDHRGPIAIASEAIETDGRYAAGIYVYGEEGVAVESDSVIVAGSTAPGIVVRTLDGDVSITSGYAEAFNDAAVAAITTSGDIVISSESALTTQEGAVTHEGGNTADAVIAFSDTGSITIDSGRAEARSDYAFAVGAISGSGAVKLVSDEALTGGLVGHAVYAESAGDVSITSGSGTTTGAQSAGVVGYSFQNDLDITSGSVRTTGDLGFGVIGQALEGAVVIDSGSVETAGDGAYGVRAVGGLGVSITSDSVVTAGDAMTTTGGQTRFAHGLIGEAIAGNVVIDSGSVSTAGDGAIGINAIAQNGSVAILSGTVEVSGDLVVTQGVDANGAPIEINNFANGVYARSQAGGDVSVDSGSITVSGLQSWGLYARAFDGATTVASDSIVTTGDGGRGVYAVGLDDVSVTAGSIETSGGYGVSSAADALYAWSQAGDVTIDVGSIATAGAQAVGIWAQAGAGAVNVSGETISTGGEGATGVRATTTGGGVEVTVGSVTTQGRYADGVFIDSGDGDATVTAASAEAFGDASAGVRVITDGGDIAIDVQEAVAHGDTLFADETDPGTFAEAITAYTASGDIAITAGRTAVSGLYASGVSAVSDAGSISITSGQVESSAEGGVALAASAGYGAIAIDSGSITAVSSGIQAIGAADIDIASETITSSGGPGAAGVYAQTSDGSIHVDSGDIEMSGDGGRGMRLDAGGTIDVVSGSIVTSGGSFVNASNAVLYSHGLHAVAAGDITVDSGSVTTTGAGAAGLLLTSNGGDVALTSDHIAVSGAGSAGIWATAAEDVAITTGDIVAAGAGAYGVRVQAQDLVLDVTGDVVAAQGYGAHLTLSGAGEINLAAGSSLQGGIAGLHLTNAGESTINILGEIVGLNGGAALVVEGAPVTINNNSNTIIGSIQLTDGVDTFNNNGTWQASGVSDFGDGEDVIVNNGLFSATSAGGVTIEGLETFENNAAIDLRNGRLGDQVNLGGAAYVGGAGSSLMVDVDFATGESDSLAVGSATGSSQIVVNDISTAEGFSPGLTFIESDTPLTGEEFVLDPSSIENGFVDYDLEFDPATNSYVIKALPSGDSVSMLRAGAAAQDYASKSGEAWSGRMEDLRDSVAAGAGRSGGTEAWGQMLFGERDLEQVADFTLLDSEVTRDISSEATWTGLQFGADHAVATGVGTMVIGFTAGYMDYEMAFSADSNRFELDGYNLGAYGAVLAGPATFSVLAKADWFKTSADLQELGARADFDGQSFDVQAEAAYRLGGDGLWFEPAAAIDWIKVDLDDLEIAGASAEFRDATSLRARLGARIGTVVRADRYVVTPSAGLYAIDELDGENEMDFTFGASSYAVTDVPYDTHGRADIGVSVSGPQALNAWAKLEADFGDGAEGLTLRLGGRWSW